MKAKLLILSISILITSTIAFQDKIDYKDINFELVELLEEVKSFIPVAMMLNTIEHYTLNYRELEIELESCFLNLTSKTHFENLEEFNIQQQKCLGDFFNFFSLFQILRNLMFQFFGENCPIEFIDTCKDFLERFEALAQRIEEQDHKFAKFLVTSDQHYKRLEENFTILKPETIHRVVMNSILTINKENFYQQLNDVLEITDQNALMDDIGGEHVDEIKIVDKKVENLQTLFEDAPAIREDPILHPSKYLLKFGNTKPIEDLKIIFKNEENESSLVS